MLSPEEGQQSLREVSLDERLHSLFKSLEKMDGLALLASIKADMETAAESDPKGA